MKNKISDRLKELLKEKGLNVSDIPFPSLRFSTKLSFNKVSTGLVETESIYILAENGKKFTTVSDLLSAGDEDNFLKRYQLMFFIVGFFFSQILWILSL